MHGRRVPAKPKHPPLVYHRAALTHFAQLVPTTLACGLALMTMSVLVALLTLVFGEVVLLVVVPRSALFRESVDERLDQAMEVAAAAARASLLSRISEGHLRELAEIERLVGDVRARCALATDASADAAVERSLALDRLMRAYIQLAIAHRRTSESFGPEGRVALDVQAARLAQVPLPPGVRASEWVARRRAILAKRQATWARASETRDVLAQELATIADVVRWVHELCALSPDDPGRAEIDDVLAGCTAAIAAASRAVEEDADIHVELLPAAS